MTKFEWCWQGLQVFWEFFHYFFERLTHKGWNGVKRSHICSTCHTSYIVSQLAPKIVIIHKNWSYGVQKLNYLIHQKSTCSKGFIFESNIRNVMVSIRTFLVHLLIHLVKIILILLKLISIWYLIRNLQKNGSTICDGGKTPKRQSYYKIGNNCLFELWQREVEKLNNI